MRVGKIFWLIILSCLVFGQEKGEQKTKREYVNVVNIELTLRIMKNGQAVGGFVKDDFKLFENGKECRINGFFETRRKIAPLVVSDTRQKTEIPQVKGRLFLLIFWTHASAVDVQAKIDYFFDKFYLPEDRIVISSMEKAFEMNRPEEKEQLLAAFMSHWDDVDRRYQAEMRGAVNSYKHAIGDVVDTIASLDGKEPDKTEKIAAAALSMFSRQCDASIREWQFFNNRIRPDDLEKMARALEAVNADKWVLIFNERLNQPLVDVDAVEQELSRAARGYFGKTIRSYIDEIKALTMKAKTENNQAAFTQTMRNRFAQAGAVVHMLQMSAKTPKNLENDLSNSNTTAISFDPVLSNWDAVFQTISKASGGQIVDMDKGLEVLDELAQLEDVSYILTYVPQAKKGKHHKVDIKIVNPAKKAYQRNLLYGRRIEMEELPPLKLLALNSHEKQLKIALESFYPVYTSNGPIGHFSVSLAAEKSGAGSAQVLFQQDIESTGLIEIPIDITAPGDWTLWVRVVDLMSGQSLLEKRKLTIVKEEEAIAAVPAIAATPQLKDELSALLMNAANYCEKLQKAALRFICREEIVEQSRNRRSRPDNPRYDKKSWQNDYQIVLDRGRLTENRLLMKKGGKKFDPPVPFKMETFYESQYSLFLPATMLSRERQDDYQYTILGRDKIKKRPLLRISAVPKTNADDLPGGEIWVDAEDGSVLKIILDAKTVPGFRDRYSNAKNRGIHLIMSDIHDYQVRYKGIRFPSSTTITENHTYTRIYEEKTLNRENLEMSSITTSRPAPPIQMDVFRILFTYDDYRFFDIDTREEIKNWVE